MPIRRFVASLVFCCVFVLSPSAFAFCGFYVSGGSADLFAEATQAVLLRDGQTTALSMQNNYKGPPEDFAMVVPVPQILQEENVKTLEKSLFDKVDNLSAPRLVEYWERDPCYSAYPRADGFGGLGMRPQLELGMRGAGSGAGGAVVVEAEFSVGEYDIVILSADEATALDNWLKSNGYTIPDGAAPYLQPYIEKGMYFFVAKVDLEKVEYDDGEAILSPLRFHYDSEEFALPIRLGMINSNGTQDLLVYILAHEQRYEVANYPNVTIPTNVEVNPRVKDDFASFYKALFSQTVEKNPRAVVTEYAWGAAKCDPCPSGIRGGATLNAQDLLTLGADVAAPSKSAPWGWVLTRMHAQYAPDDIGKDLVFRKAGPIVGGREMPVTGPSAPTAGLEKGSRDGKQNNFQGRYIIRNEWEGKVACDNPEFGVWGGPPDARGMRLVADTVLTTLRREKAIEAGEEVPPLEKLLEAPTTPAEAKAIGFQLRKKYGTSEPPAGEAGRGTLTATSPNTRVAPISIPSAPLGSFLAESVPEIDAEPIEAAEPVETMRTEDTTGDGGTTGPSMRAYAPGAKTPDARPRQTSGCSSGHGAPSSTLPILLLGLLFGRRRRES